MQNNSQWPCSKCPSLQFRLVGVRISIIFPGHPTFWTLLQIPLRGGWLYPVTSITITFCFLQFFPFSSMMTSLRMETHKCAPEKVHFIYLLHHPHPSPASLLIVRLLPLRTVHKILVNYTQTHKKWCCKDTPVPLRITGRIFKFSFTEIAVL